MNLLKRNVLLTFVFCICFITGYSQKMAFQENKLPVGNFYSNNKSDIFGNQHVFINNIGQIQDSIYEKNNKILYVFEGLNGPVLFTEQGLIILHQKVNPTTDIEKEKEHFNFANEAEIENSFQILEKRVYLQWANANPHPTIIAENPVSNNFTYGALQQAAKGYSSLTYKNLYPGIHLKFSFKKEQQHGFEFSFQIEPGANISQINMQFFGDLLQMNKNNKGDILLRTAIDTTYFSAPVCFYEKSPSVKLPIQFINTGKSLQFKITAPYDKTQPIIIDPFVSGTTNLSGANSGKATDIDFDYLGNVYISGGGDGNNHKLAKYDGSGNLLWTFTGTLTSPVWSFGPYYGGWVVEKPTGSVYVGQGFIPNGYRIIRLNPAGIYDNYITDANPMFRENWKMYWNCNEGTPQIIIAGGGTNSDVNLGYLDPTTTTISSSSITDVPYSGASGWAQDIADVIIDPKNNEMYTIFASLIGTPSLNNKIYKHSAPYSPATIAWSRTSGYNALTEVGNRPYMSISMQDNGINALAVNSDYFFYWDGRNLKAFNKATGADVGTPLTIAANGNLMCGGIAADECNQVFIGSTNGTIKVYKFNGSSFDDAGVADISIPGFATASVYDLTYNEPSKLLYACGNGFVTAIDVSAYACTNTTYTLIVTPDCQNGAVTATVSPIPSGTYTITYELYQGTTLLGTNTTGTFFNLQQGINYTIKAYINLVCSGVVTQKTFTIPGPTLTSSSTSATCGNNNGTIIANANGGSLPYTYSIDGTNFQSSNSFNGLAAGMYILTVKDGTGCSTNDTLIVLNSNGPSLTNTHTNALCSVPNGSILANGTGGTAPLQFSIDGITFQSQPLFPGLAAGNYTLTVRDQTGCTNINLISITQIDAPTITGTPTTASCNNSNGVIHLYGSGGTAPLQYSINGGAFQASGTFSNLASGTYNCIVKDNNGCNASITLTVDNSLGPDVNLNTTMAGCGNNNGTITVTATGGIPPLQYSLTGTTYQSGILFSGLAPGIYTVYVKDAGNCIKTVSTTIGTTQGPSITATANTASCNATNGKITVTAVGGQAPYQYSLNGITFQASNIFNGLAAGTYIITVRDFAGCYSGTSATIIQATAPVLSATISPSTCNAVNGAITANITGGTAPFQYQLNNGTLQSSNIFNGLSYGTYVLTVVDGNNCLASTTVTLTNAMGLSASAATLNSSCNSNNGIITVTATGNALPLQYSINGVTFQSSNLFTGLGGGNYTITIKDANGCKITIPATIIVDAAPQIFVNITDASCNTNSGIIEVSGSDGTPPYLFQLNSGAFQSSGLYEHLAPGNYTVTLKDGGNCTVSQTVTITNTGVGNGPTSITAQFKPAHCGNDEGKIVKIKTVGGTAPYQYSLNGGPYTTDTFFLPLPPGLYTVTVMDDNGCTNYITGTITDMPGATVTAISTPTPCNTSNGTIIATGHDGTAPYQFSIDFGANWQTSNTFTGLSAGTYTIIIWDDEDCQTQVDVTVYNTGGPTISTVVTQASCGLFNGAIVATATGGTGNLQYTIDGFSYQSTGEFYDLGPGTYIVSVIDDAGCTNAATVVIADTGAPTIEATTVDATCETNNGSITITGTGTAPLYYSIDGTLFQLGNSFTNLTPGFYSIYVKDANSCYATMDVEIVKTPITQVIAYSIPASCGNSTGSIIVIASEGTAPYQYSIDGTNYQSSNLFSNIAAGSFTVWVRDASGCIVTSGINVANLQAPNISLNADNEHCGLVDGTITANGTGGTGLLEYSIDGNTYTNNNIFTGLAQGTYTIFVRDANGCKNSETINLSNEPGPQQLTAQIIDEACSLSDGAIIAISGDGTIPLEFSIDNTNYQFSEYFSGLSSGNYTLTVRDPNGCELSIPVHIGQVAAPTINTSSTNAECGNNNGSITITASGTSLPFYFSIDDINYVDNNSFTFLTPGTYNASVIDNRGCISSEVVVIGNTSGPTISGSSTDASCGIDDGTITAIASGGTGALQYSLDGTNFQSANIFTGLAVGTYFITVMDQSGCANTSAAILINATGSVSSSTSLSLCNNQLPYNWNGTPLNTGGTYTQTLVSYNGCDSIATLVLTVKATTSSTTNIAVCNNLLPYSWNGSSYNAAGTFTKTLVGTNGCDSIATLNLTIKATTSSTTNIAICSNLLPYSWNGSSYNAAGTFTKTLIGSNGCDSIATLNLTIKATTSSTTNIAICSNLLPYTWNGSSYNAAGTFTKTLIGANGCDSIATLNLTINATTSSTTNIAVCSNLLPYTWNGSSYNAAGTFTKTLVGANGCDSIATLNLTVKATTTSTTNIAVCSNLLPYTWNGSSYNAAGTFTKTLISANGCDSIATLNLTINATTASTTNIAVCSNLLPYTWNGSSYNAAGTFTKTLVGTNGCDSIAILNLTIKATTSSTTNIAICSNLLPYTWNGSSYTAAGTFTKTLIGANGCDSIATLNLTINATTSSTTNIAVCSNLLPYTWNGSSYNAAGTFTKTLIGANGCDSIATLNLTINATTASTTNIAVCSNLLPYTWNGSSYNAAGTFTKTLVGANGCDSIATLNLTINATTSSTTNIAVCSNLLPYTWNGSSYNAAGTFTKTLIGANGCDSIATLNLTVKAITTSTTNIAVCSNLLPYTWNGSSYNAAGTFTKTLIGANGCDSIATLNLTINATTSSTTNIAV
ncbi:MAG: hypothetical protein RLY16_426, partial [Bacteroidota bacterium]